MPRARAMPSDLLRWIEAQPPGSIMRPDTFRRIKQAAYDRLRAKGVPDEEAHPRAVKQAGSAYWRAAVKKYFLATGKLPDKKEGRRRMKKNPVLAVMGNPRDRVPPHELARILRRDLGTVRKAISYARKIEASGGAYAQDYGEAADYLERMYPVAAVAAQKEKANPPRAGEIFSLHVHAITYTHKGDGLDYKHEFAEGVHMRANRDGSITLYHPDKAIWRDFP